MDDKRTFGQVAFTHFVPCFFLGVIFLFFVRAYLPDFSINELADTRFSPMDILAGVANGLFVALLVLVFHLVRNRRIKSGRTVFDRRADRNTFVYGSLIGFLSGAFDILFGFHDQGIIFLTAIVLFILVWHIRKFTASVVEMLKPDNHTTWREVSELLRVYMTMLAGFTLINATLEVAHVLTKTPVPFGFGAGEGELFLNAFYYTVVTMTTLGYGDIVPRTWDGKILLIFQCLVSYIMFALIVGIITRGVVKRKSTEQE